MHKLIVAYQKFNENLAKRGIIDGLPEVPERYSVTYDLLENDTVWRLHINAGEMSLVAHINEEGVIESYLPFKQCPMEKLLRGNTERKISYDEYREIVHPIVETMLDKETTKNES